MTVVLYTGVHNKYLCAIRKTNNANQIIATIPRIQSIYFPRQGNLDLYDNSDAQTRFIFQDLLPILVSSNLRHRTVHFPLHAV
jgi:hypothetical protein